MGQLPSRDIRQVAVGSLYVDVMDRFGNMQQVSLEQLSNPELNKAAKLAFPETKGNRWFGVDMAGKVSAILTGEVPQIVLDDPEPKAVTTTPTPVAMPVAMPVEPINKPDPQLQALIDEETAPVEPIKAETGTGNGVSQAIVDLVKAAGLTGQVDETQVRRIAAEVAAQVLSENVAELLNEVSRPQVHHVSLPNHAEPVIIEGRQHEEFQNVLRLVSMGLNVWLTGPAGTGKTKLAENVAEALSKPFYTLSCDPTMQRSNLFGFVDAGGSYRPTLYREAYENGGVFLLDEIDNSHPSILAGINQSAANGLGAFPDGMVKKNDGSVLIAAANTFGTGPTDEYVGRLKIDAATINRFFRVFIGTDELLEADLVKARMTDQVQAERWLTMVRKHRSNASDHKLRVIVSMRDAIDGATAIEGGFDMQQVAEWRWLAGLGEDDRRKVAGR